MKPIGKLEEYQKKKGKIITTGYLEILYLSDSSKKLRKRIQRYIYEGYLIKHPIKYGVFIIKQKEEKNDEKRI